VIIARHKVDCVSKQCNGSDDTDSHGKHIKTSSKVRLKGYHYIVSACTKLTVYIRQQI
jgi:hypothetical protein